MSKSVLSTSRLRVEVHPAHGAVISWLGVPGGPNLLWEAPGRSFAPLTGEMGRTGLGSLERFTRDVFAGGWFMMFPTAGPPGEDEHSWAHGEAMWSPWNVVEFDCASITMELTTPHSGMHLRRTLSLHGATLTVNVIATNQSGAIQHIALGEHPCVRSELFAGGVIGAGPRSAATASTANASSNRLRGASAFTWPYAATTGGQLLSVRDIPLVPDGREDHILLEFDTGHITVSSPALRLLLLLDWDATVLPYAMVWQHYRPANTPWDAEVLAIEPTSTPGRTHQESISGQHLITLQPGKSLSYNVSLSLEPLT